MTERYNRDCDMYKNPITKVKRKEDQMIHIEKDIKCGSQTAKLFTYFLDASPEIDGKRMRPVVLICPGGAYRMTSDREAEAVAIQMCARGFHACVLRYSTGREAPFPAALVQLAKSVAWLRMYSEEYHIDPDKITVCGFSAGGHLAASLGVYWQSGMLSGHTRLSPDRMRPNRLLLCYPVITSGQFGHRESFENLGGAAGSSEELLEACSLEKHVSDQVPPVFLWHTGTDATVPVENSLLFAMELQKAGIPMEFHIYQKGRHGLSLGTEEIGSAEEGYVVPAVQNWIDLACAWLKRWE